MSCGSGVASVEMMATRNSEQMGSVIARNVLHLSLGQIGTTLLSVLLTAILARSLGPGDFGVYFLLSSIATFSYVFVEWGQHRFVVPEVAREPRRAGELVGTGLAFRLIAASIVFFPLLLI